MVHSNPAFDAFRVQFDAALESLDYATSDAIIDMPRGHVVVSNAGKSAYGEWRRSTERLEGLNAALFGAACGASRLNRFTGSLGELDSYRRGRWRREGGAQDRVPAAVGESSRLLEKGAVAMVTYSAGALTGWTQPVRYSPHPRSPDAGRGRFGAEKGGQLAGGGGVHARAGCPIPARDRIEIAPLPCCT